MNSQAMQQQLSQIYMLMDMEEHDCHQYASLAPASAPSHSSSSFRSFSTGTSRDDNSTSLMLAAADTSTNTAASCHHRHQQPEVSSQIGAPPLSICHQETHPPQSRRSGGGHGAAAASAFRSYSRYLGPRKTLRPGATTGGGQRAFKKAISVLSKIHTVRLAQYYQIMEMAAAQARSPPVTGSSGDSSNQQQQQQLQLQHVLSERKRREKLNDSFKALRDVLPPATKKDKASILMRAKDYVNVLKARVAELEEKNRMLAESQSQLHAGDGDGGGELQVDDKRDDDDDGGDRIEVDVGRSAAEGTADKCQELHLKIVLGSSSACSAMDAVAGILKGLNEKRDARLLATGSSGRLPRAKSSQQPPSKATANVQFIPQSSSSDEDIVKEAVIKVIKDVMQPEKVLRT
uniref:BHLH domain-containing protein n=1 Tax=Oryza brachyantha TaxID=4533 RepID=J3M4R3_ORYBR